GDQGERRLAGAADNRAAGDADRRGALERGDFSAAGDVPLLVSPRRGPRGAPDAGPSRGAGLRRRHRHAGAVPARAARATRDAGRIAGRRALAAGVLSQPGPRPEHSELSVHGTQFRRCVAGGLRVLPDRLRPVRGPRGHLGRRGGGGAGATDGRPRNVGRRMNADAVRTLYRFSAWATGRILDHAARLRPDELAKPSGASFSTVRETPVHIMAAQLIWLSRWQGTSPTSLLGAREFPDVASIRARWSLIEADTQRFVAGVTDGDLAKVVEYRNTRGERWAYPLWQQLVHQ